MKIRQSVMAKRRAAQKAQVALAAVNEDSESDVEMKREVAYESESSFESVSSDSDEENEMQAKQVVRTKQKYDVNSSEDSSSSESSGDEAIRPVVMRQNKRRLVRPMKGSSESSSEEEKLPRQPAKSLANGNKVGREINSLALRPSSTDVKRLVRKKLTQVQGGKLKNTDVSSSNKLARSSSSSEEESQLKEKLAPKNFTVRGHQVNKSRSIKGSSSSSSSSGDDSELPKTPQMSKLKSLKTGKDLKKRGSSNTFGLSGSSSSSDSENSELAQSSPYKEAFTDATKKLGNSTKGVQPSSSGSSSSDSEGGDLDKKKSQKKPRSVKSSNSSTNVIDLRIFRSLGSSEEEIQVDEKLDQKVMDSRKDTVDSSSASDSNFSDEELKSEQPKQMPVQSENKKITKVASDSSDLDELSSSTSDEEISKQNTNEPLNIQPKSYDIVSESDSNEGGSASDSDLDVAWQPLDEEMKESENSETDDDIVAESRKESDSEMEEDATREDGELAENGDANDGNVSESEVKQAKFVMRNITSRVPLIEETAIRRGVMPTGPPIEFATTHLDEFAKKFRWPQHLRNLRNREFSQDPSEIFEDYEVLPDTKQRRKHEDQQDAPSESPFAQVPRPIVTLAAEALRHSSRKRKRAADRDNNEEPSDEPLSACALLNIARIGGSFGDEFVESLLSANGKALQGIDSGFPYDKRCWSSLPTKKKPIANWRFVLEHVRRTMCLPKHSDTAIPPSMKKETLERITKRLKNLYGHATVHEEYDIFKVAAGPKSNDTGQEDGK